MAVFCSSSFQTQSVPLLHILSRLETPIPVVFLNTGYLFPDTLVFRDQLVARLGLRLLEVSSPVDRHLQRDPAGRLLFASDPDRCCHLNKILPMEPILQTHDVWVNGVRRDQTATRSQLQVEQPGRHGTLRFHPMLDWTARDISAYMERHNLPRHPLEEAGYPSIGCEPCTRRVDLSDPESVRRGRWFGLQKTECGLHTELARPDEAQEPP